MNDSFQYGDIIFLGLIAIFVAFRLRSMLGRNMGIDPRDIWKNATRGNIAPVNGQPQPSIIVKKPSEEEVVPMELQNNQPVSDGLQAIRKADPSFSTTEFIAGAKLAFEWIVEAFSKGDKEKLRALLSPERFQHFSEEIDANAASGTKRETTLISILATDITDAAMQGKVAHITIQFTSEQMSIMRDKDKNIVSGSPSNVEKAIDVWTFERDTSSRDPNWKIIAT